MAKFTKEQNQKFNKLFETTIDWGENENCTGLFCDILANYIDHESHNLYYLTTCVQEAHSQIEVLEFDGCGYYDLLGYIPLGPKTKATLKNCVMCLIDGGSFTDIRKFVM